MTLRIAVLDDYQRVARDLADWAALGAGCEVEFFHENMDEEAAATALAEFDVLCLMRERLPLRAALIERLPRLKLAVITGTNARAIDLQVAAARGVTVCGTRGGEGGVATPELAWGLILAVARSIPREDANVRAGRWQETLGMTLRGRTLGLLGLGRIGARMVPVAQAFGMNVIAFSPNLTDERAAEVGARRVKKDELFRQADVVSIHVVLGDRSRGLVGAREIGLMKPGAILVNTARGPIVDEVALVDALREGRIRAGLDVYDTEPLPADHPLRTAPGTVLMPHLGYVTEAGYREFYEDTVAAIRAWRDGEPVRVFAAPGGAA